MDSLPSELLGVIFDLGSCDVEPISLRTIYPVPFTLLVSSVCHDWRNIAISTPSIWTRICLDRRFHRDYLSMWTERSKSYLLDIVITVVPPPSTLDLLGAQSSRWRSLCINIHSYEAILAIINPLRRLNFPSLHRLQFINGSSEPWSNVVLIMADPVHEPLFAHEFPVLRSVKVKGLCSRCCTTFLKNLTFLEISSFAPTYAEMKALVTASPELQTLVLPSFSCGIAPQSDTRNRLPRIEISSLKSFGIGFDWNHKESPCRCLLPYFSMPNLKHLEISGDDSTPHLSTHFYLPSGQSSFSELKTIRLHSLEASIHESGFYHAFPCITTLELVDVGRITSLFLGPPDAHTTSRTQDQPWPCLKCIKLDLPANKELLEWLMTTVRTRIEMRLPLSRICMTASMFQLLSYACASEFDTLRTQVEVELSSLEETGLINLTDDMEMDSEELELSDYDDPDWDEESFEIEDDESDRNDDGGWDD